MNYVILSYFIIAVMATFSLSFISKESLDKANKEA